MRHTEDHFTLITAAAAQWHDFEVLKNALPADGSLSLTDHTAEFGTLIVTGPQSRELFAKLSDADLSLGWLTHQSATVAGQPAALARVSFAGELGWEVHSKVEHLPEIYAAVLAAGAVPFGMFALNSLRLEKGYRAWKGDLSTYRTQQSIALGMLRADLVAPGTEVEVEIYGKRCMAVVQEDRPLWDPENARLRA